MTRALDLILTYGEEGLFITRYLVSKVVGGRRDSIADSLIDLSWNTFKAVNAEVTERWITKWPGRTKDRNKKVRDFFHRHKKYRFKKYIETGEGKCGHLNVSSFFYHSLNLASRVASTGYTPAFLNTLPELVAIGGRGINAGDDPPEADEEHADESVFTDKHDQDETGHHDEDPPEQQPEPGLYPDLEEELRHTVTELVDLDLNKNGDGYSMKTFTKRINYYLPAVTGAPIDVPTAFHVVLAVLEPGTQVSTITSSLSKNQQDGVVRAMLAPELNEAQKVIPYKVCLNDPLGQSLALAIQEVLNQEETDNDPFKPRPLSKGNFRLSHRGDISGVDGPIDPTYLGFTPDTPGDHFMLHRVGVSNPNGTVPCYVAIFFFLEEYPENLSRVNHASHPPAENLRESPASHSTS
jgi:hypothetical protein